MKQVKALGEVIKVGPSPSGSLAYYNRQGRLIWDTAKIRAEEVRAVLFIHGSDTKEVR